ncbi:MAG: hypothetical protein IIC13_15615 [SAR324 cluster bacterium]|nr:hypothetical protein [SAR324 cluster bacterium]
MKREVFIEGDPFASVYSVLIAGVPGRVCDVSPVRLASPQKSAILSATGRVLEPCY